MGVERDGACWGAMALIRDYAAELANDGVSEQLTASEMDTSKPAKPAAAASC